MVIYKMEFMEIDDVQFKITFHPLINLKTNLFL